MTDNSIEADHRLITAAEEMLAHHRGELELESRKQEGDLEQRIKTALQSDRVIDSHRVIIELLGLISIKRVALETCKCGAGGYKTYWNDEAQVKHALTLSAPLQGWKEWGV
jgi:hypothetical protein